MGIEIILGLLGGLALFLYGMQMMSTGLEAAAGDRLKSILEKLTSNRFLGVIVGALITAVIQSSSATTVMVVGFVNAKMMTLRQAVWIIMGANIGTTITGQLIALDVGMLAPLFAFVGVAIIVFIKNPKLHNYAKILAGLGILFIGMDMMSGAMHPLRESQLFIDLVTNFSNPLIGILVGAVFTAIIQSSSASVGILQALAMSGIIDLSQAVFVLFGQNIGTCITSLLASVGTSREAKQSTTIHMLFNIIGTVIFTVACIFFPLAKFVESWTPTDVAQQIANMHTLFNIATTIILIPFGYKLADLAEKIIAPEKEAPKFETNFQYNSRMFGATAINIQNIDNAVLHMRELAYKNVFEAFKQLENFDEEKHKKILEREKNVNALNMDINDHISEVLADGRLNLNISEALSTYYLLLVDIERISDYAVSIEKQANVHREIEISEDDSNLIKNMANAVEEMKNLYNNASLAYERNKELHKTTHNWRLDEIQNLKDKKTTSELSVMLSRILTYYERINDHALNIAEGFEKIDSNLHNN